MSARAPGVAPGVEPASLRRRGERGDSRRRDLARLRLRLCVLYGLASCVGLVVLATLVTVVDGRSRTQSLRSELHRRASLASALAFPDEDGVPQTSAIEDDGIVSDGQVDLVLFSGAGSGPFRLVCVVDDDGPLCDEPSDVRRWQGFESLADAPFLVGAVQDEVDTGTFGRAPGPRGSTLAAVAVPLYDDQRASGAVVAVDRGALAEADQHDRLVMMTWLGCGLLVIASTVAGWLVAGRSIRPVVDALDQQERFLADAAHELRTPVSRVRAVAESALLSLDGLIRTLPHPKERGDELQGRLDEVQADLRRTVELAEGNGRVVNDLLFMSRVDADAVDLRRGPVRLDQLVSRLEDDHPDVVAEVDEPLIVHGDEVLLLRVLENLIDNARAHGQPPPGTPMPPIELSVWRSSPGDRQQGESSPMAVVTVADHGTGIAPDVLARAFERYGARTGSPGAGLGLAIVAWVVERHGGSVVAVNRRSPETGAIVGIRLPLARSVG